MKNLDQELVDYLRGPAPHKLEIGAGQNGKQGWLATDLRSGSSAGGLRIIALDASKDFPIPSDSLDFIYMEHMIEHISFEKGQGMLAECNRILKPGGVVRIVTPSLGLLIKMISSDRSALEERYRKWSVETFVPDAPRITNAFFFNNFVRAWGHTFIYDHETLILAMRLAGLEMIKVCDLNVSEHSALCGLENVARLPPGFLDLESIVLEGVKGVSPIPLSAGENVALGKLATQSSISKWSREATPRKDATRVVSGSFSGTYNCHTDLEDKPWWRVDLERVCRISQIRIWNRVAEPAIARRTSRFEIQISNDDKKWETVFRKDDQKLVRGVTGQSPFVWVPNHVLQARFVRIQLLEREFLHLEQVEIYGESE